MFEACHLKTHSKKLIISAHTKKTMHVIFARHAMIRASLGVGGVGARVERVGSNGERVAGGLRDGVGL